MARVATYLDVNGDAEEAFDSYPTVFGIDNDGPNNRLGDAPPAAGGPSIPEG